MQYRAQKFRAAQALLFAILMTRAVRGATPEAAPQTPSTSSSNLAQLIGAIRGKAKLLEGASGMHSSFRSFTTAYKLPPESVSYSDYVVARLLYEATRDAGFWNL